MAEVIIISTIAVESEVNKGTIFKVVFNKS